MTEYTLTQITIPEREVRKVTLTDEQWRSLQALSGLPSEAREEVQSAVDRYCEMKSSKLPPSAEVRKFCRKISNDARNLASALEEYILHYFEGSFDDTDDEEPLARIIDFEWDSFRVAEVAYELTALADRFSRTARNVERDRPGPSDRALWFFVCSLDKILKEYTRRGVSRSTNKGSTLYFVRAACLIATGDEGIRGVDFAIRSLARKKKRKSKIR